MTRNWFWLVIFLLAVASCRGRKSPAPEPTPPAVEVSDITAEAEAWADSVSSRMTLRQKVSQMFMPALYASDDFWTLRQVRQYADSCVGGVVLLKGDARGASAIADTLRGRWPAGAFVAIDAEWGLAMRLADAPEFPDNRSISPGADEQLMYDYGRELARECRVLGVNMVLGPVVDVSVPGGFMGRRSYGDDPRRVADLALAYARGLEDGDVVSVAKHFPGHGSVTADSHKRKGVIERSLNEMDSIDLYPFRKWIEQHLSGIMVGHLAVPSIDSEMRPAAMSRTVVTDLLRDDLGFDGLVLTDAINMKGAEGLGSAEAVKAGADIIVAPAQTWREIDEVVAAVRRGEIAENVIDSRVRRILFYKYLLGLDRSIGPRAPVAPGSLDSPDADTIARRLRAR